MINENESYLLAAILESFGQASFIPMAILLSEKDQPISLDANAHASASNNYELVIPSSQVKSRGYKRSLNFSHGLNLLIRDYWLQDTLIEELLPEPEGLTLEFGFNIAIATETDLPSPAPPQASFVQVGPNRTYADTTEWPYRGQLLKLDLHLRALAATTQCSAGLARRRRVFSSQFNIGHCLGQRHGSAR